MRKLLRRLLWRPAEIYQADSVTFGTVGTTSVATVWFRPERPTLLGRMVGARQGRHELA
jgi:hypothetical protein